MRRLRDNKADLAALITSASDAAGIPHAFVEKDFWVVELLRSLAQPIDGGHVIFKGGTSLSKAYDLVQRFSEDVDILLVADAGSGERRRDKLLKALCARAEADLGTSGELVFSKTGVVRNVRYPYQSGFRDTRVTEGVLLEMGIRGGPDPNERKMLRSYLSVHATEERGLADSEYEEFSPVAIHVLRPQRTLVEKLSIVHHLETLDDLEIRSSDKGRHFYDIYQLLGDGDVVAGLEDLAYVATAAADAESHSSANGWPYTPRPAGGYATSPAFDLAGPKAGSLGEAYERASGLIYGPVPSFDEIVRRVHARPEIL